jgi:pyruvate-formate lyase
MLYKPVPVSERIHKIKDEYKKMAVPQEDNPYVDKKYRHFCTGDRWITLGFLEGWLKHEDAPTSLRRRSLAEAAELYAAEPIITDNELITGHLYLPEYTAEEQERYEKLCDMYRMSNTGLLERGPRIDHICLDFDKLLRVGIEGLIGEIKSHKATLNLYNRDIYPDFEEIKKYDFYECCIIELEAVIDLQKRYAAKARQMAQQASGQRRIELNRIADALERVPAEPAETFFEAIQSVQFYLGCLFGLYPLGRPDRYLLPFYESDIASGIITQKDAQELIDNFCLHVSTRVFSRAACGFIVGGMDHTGKIVENDLTYMFLTALDHIRMPDPNGALAVTSDTSDEILRYSAQILAKGVTHPAFYNDDVIRQSLVRYGCSKEDSVNYIHCTCAEIGVIGKSKVHTGCFVVDLPQLLKAAACEAEESGYDDLQANFLKRITDEFHRNTFRYVMRMLEAARNGNEPMRVSCLVDDCIRRGKSIYEGGERYCFLQPILVGFSTVVDSLLAIRQIVYEEKQITLKEFNRIVNNDFAGNEALRQYIIHHVPHYGNDIPEADETAAWLAESILQIIQADRVLAGNCIIPGTFSYVSHASLGAAAGATYDGRRAHFPYSDGSGPVQGRDISGPTAMVLSMTSWDQSAYLGGMVVNIKFAPEHMTGDKTDAFVQILRTFMQRGGIEMQVNVVDRQTLEDAYIHPENHGDLIVRIGGYSDYFVRLSKALQLEIIERTEY